MPEEDNNKQLYRFHLQNLVLVDEFNADSSINKTHSTTINAKIKNSSNGIFSFIAPLHYKEKNQI